MLATIYSPQMLDLFARFKAILAPAGVFTPGVLVDPEPIADRLKHDTRTIAEDFAEVSVMFADIVGFTQIAARLRPIELINLLNQVQVIL